MEVKERLLVSLPSLKKVSRLPYGAVKDQTIIEPLIVNHSVIVLFTQVSVKLDIITSG